MSDLDGSTGSSPDVEAVRRAEAIAGDYHPSRPEHPDPDASRLHEAADLLRAGPAADDHAVRLACAHLLIEVARCRRAGEHVAPAVTEAVDAIAVGTIEPPPAIRAVTVRPPVSALRHCLDRA